MWKTCVEPPREVHVDRLHRRERAPAEPEAGDGDEEVEQPRSTRVARAWTSMKPPPPGARQRALGDPRREAGRDARVDRVPALREHARARLGGERVAGGDRPFTQGA